MKKFLTLVSIFFIFSLPFLVVDRSESKSTEVQFNNIGTPADAVNLALQDASQFQYPEKLRYIWISGKLSKDQINDAKLVFYTANLLSRSPIKFKPQIIASDKVMLVRLNTEDFVKNREEWFEFVDKYEELRFDPKFSGLLTNGSLKLSKLSPLGVSRKIVTRKIGVVTRRLVEEENAQTALNRDGVLRFVPDHVGKNWLILSQLLFTEAPVIDFKYFTYRTTNSISDKKIYKTIYGGLYYQLAGIPTSKDKKKQTDLDALLESLGVGGRGKTAKQIFEEIPSDSRLALFKSNVTARLRRIEWFPILTGQEHPGWFRLTSDFAREDIDIDQSPIANLLDGILPKAHEAIYTRLNGLPGFVLYDDKFTLQETAPETVVVDHLSKPPQLTQLYSCFSCIRCHAKADNWQYAANDIKKMINSKRIDILGDLSQRDNFDANRRIIGLYLGDQDSVARFARNHYVLTIYNVTGYWPESKDQTDLAKIVANRMDSVVNKYYHIGIDAKTALEEMGYELNQKDAADFLYDKVFDLRNRKILVDHRVAGLVTGIEINRSEFDLLYSFIMKPN